MRTKKIFVCAVISVFLMVMAIPADSADFNFVGKWNQIEDPDTVKTIKELSNGTFAVIGYSNAGGWKTHGVGMITSKGFLIWSWVNDGDGDAGFGTLRPMKNNQFSQESYNTDGTKRSKVTYIRMR